MFDEAVKHFRSSLKCNPYLWSSFEALCHLGMSVECAAVTMVMLSCICSMYWTVVWISVTTCCHICCPCVVHVLSMCCYMCCYMCCTGMLLYGLNHKSVIILCI